LTCVNVEKNTPVLHVYHFDDGSWQFSGPEENLIDEDYRVISLGEILSLDVSLSLLGNLEIGFEALRNSKQDDWIFVSGN
jgi:hypothetical protein